MLNVYIAIHKLALNENSENNFQYSLITFILIKFKVELHVLTLVG